MTIFYRKNQISEQSAIKAHHEDALRMWNNKRFCQLKFQFETRCGSEKFKSKIYLNLETFIF